MLKEHQLSWVRSEPATDDLGLVRGSAAPSRPQLLLPVPPPTLGKGTIHICAEESLENTSPPPRLRLGNLAPSEGYPATDAAWLFPPE